MLKAGTAIIDITPPLGVELGGYPHYPRNNTGAHDPLCAACMYLADGGKEIAMVTLDLLYISKPQTTEIRRRVEAACGIPAGNIMISASHTHSSPWMSARLDLEALEEGYNKPEAYFEEAIEKIAAVIIEAKKNAFDAAFTSGIALCGADQGVGGNRRLPGGPHDPLVTVMAVKDTQDIVRGIFVNYALHPTFIHEWSNLCTADYPAYIRIQLNEMEKDAVVGFSQGASGNQSSRYYRQGESFDEAERVGRLIGKAAHTVLDKAVWLNELDIRIANKTIEFVLRDFGTEEELRAQLAKDQQIYNELNEKYGQSTNRDEYYLVQNANLKLLGSEERLGYVLFQKTGRPMEILVEEAPAELQVIRLSDTCVVGVPGEYFVEYGLYIKAMAGFEKVVFNTNANGCLPGYMYTPESFATGGYETDTSMLDITFGRKLMNAILDLTEEVR